MSDNAADVPLKIWDDGINEIIHNLECGLFIIKLL